MAPLEFSLVESVYICLFDLIFYLLLFTHCSPGLVALFLFPECTKHVFLRVFVIAVSPALNVTFPDICRFDFYTFSQVCEECHQNTEVFLEYYIYKTEPLLITGTFFLPNLESIFFFIVTTAYYICRLYNTVYMCIINV